MSRDYITEYSYGVAESFNLIAPRLFGGSNREAVGTDSSMYSFMVGQGVPESQAADFTSGLPLIGRSADSSCSCVYRCSFL
jgi:hypothetical protein